MTSNRLTRKLLFLVLSMAVLFCATAEARLYRLWGGQATVDVPPGLRLRSAGSNGYMILSMARGANPRVASLVLTRSLGSQENVDWTELIRHWRTSMELTPGLRALVPPHAVGDTFNVEFATGRGRGSARYKLRAIHRPRSNDMDLFNLHTVHLTVTPASAWGAPEVRGLLRAFRSVRVRK